LGEEKEGKDYLWGPDYSIRGEASVRKGNWHNWRVLHSDLAQKGVIL